ncbi:AMP-binding protein [Methylocapsa acidiphila]|uniref:AMP-binding protein n=1 Tax=Methylocapsa acidiphila TaxID=133552 RepID=UPI00040A1FA0|nr:AMP-binding protein [Methylocapsa acidiphila]
MLKSAAADADDAASRSWQPLIKPSAKLPEAYGALSQLESSRWRELVNIRSWADRWDMAVEAHPYDVAVEEVEGRRWTWEELDDAANRIGAWAASTGRARIGLRGEGAEYLAAVVGLTKAGVEAALLSDRDPPELSASRARLAGVDIVIGSPSPGATGDSFQSILSMSQGGISSSARESVKLDDTALVIFTSGTSGRVKAARFSHKRLVGAGVAWGLRTGIRRDDRCYISLPLNHGNGLAVAFGACVEIGATAVIRAKFSASAFLDDVRRYRCTSMVYIGELWRLLDRIPRLESDRDTPLRIAFGNGLRRDLWRKTVERFGLTHVVEHYGATEMPAGALTNWTGRPGACGYVPPDHPDADEVVLIDESGCPVAAEESGELLLRVAEGKYDGYLDADLNEAKIWRNLFASGDMWWRSGDVLRRDAEGFFEFVDRLGDSFRWKGENHSSVEVEEALLATGLVLEAAVVGVPIPGHDGKVGLASILSASDFDPDLLLEQLRMRLPSTAIPCFLRLSDASHALTATLKKMKSDLAEKGPGGLPGIWLVLHQGRYLPLNEMRLRAVKEGGSDPDFRTR